MRAQHGRCAESSTTSFHAVRRNNRLSVNGFAYQKYANEYRFKKVPVAGHPDLADSFSDAEVGHYMQ